MVMCSMPAMCRLFERSNKRVTPGSSQLALALHLQLVFCNPLNNDLGAIGEVAVHSSSIKTGRDEDLDQI